MLDRIRAKRDDVRQLTRRYKGENVYVFGSCARKEETPQSDIDFMVDFQRGATLFSMAELQDGLQKMFGRAVDLITAKSLKDDSFGNRVRAEMVAI